MADPDDVLTDEDCWGLLRSNRLGRLAVSHEALPAIVPAQYYVDGQLLAICLGSYRLLRRSVDDAVVAFAADSIDPDTGTGWSVEVKGVANLTAAPTHAQPECGGATSGWILHLEPVVIAGHRIELCPFIEEAANKLS
jgi:nitroimidazol reductase NimA-like FMN-containing flavoprotein (pyridoxamine 5'-phosphate oxidase superfamily)